MGAAVSDDKPIIETDLAKIAAAVRTRKRIYAGLARAHIRVSRKAALDFINNSPLRGPIDASVYDDCVFIHEART
jgi:hypothetical protein